MSPVFNYRAEARSAQTHKEKVAGGAVLQGMDITSESCTSHSQALMERGQAHDPSAPQNVPRALTEEIKKKILCTMQT